MDQYEGGFRLSLRNRTRRIGARIASTDGRWTLVSSALTLLVAGAVSWMAVGTMPVLGPRAAPARVSLPYELFLRLVHSGGADQLASIAPQFRKPEAQEESPPVPEIGNRTITLAPGDTLAGTMEDAGVSPSDAAAAIAALGKDFKPRALKAGMSFDITYNVAPPPAQPAAPKTTVVMVNHKPVVVPVEEDSDAGATATKAQAITRLLSVHFSPTVEQDITITRALDGSFSAQNVQKTLIEHHHRVGGTIDSSLYLAGTQARIPTDIVQEMNTM